MSSHIYHGPWINWEHGAISGATLTLGNRNGGLLTSFIATFVTLVGTQLWRILCYAFHQVRSSQQPQDGLHYQQQVVFRNIASPGGAAWTFLQQAFHWRSRARLSLIRTLPWALFSALYLGLFALTAVFSSEISKASGSSRLIIGDTCGYWNLGNASSPQALNSAFAKDANDTLTAASYARACYGNTDPVLCTRYSVDHLPWTSKRNVTCPFTSGFCLEGSTAAYEMTTDLLDSHLHLGINTPKHHRVQWQKRTTCAPIQRRGYVTLYNVTAEDTELGKPGDTIMVYNYGTQNGVSKQYQNGNYTWSYNIHAAIDISTYTLYSMYMFAGNTTSPWQALPALSQTGASADLSLVFLAANGVSFLAECDDPMFPVHTTLGTSINSTVETTYTTDVYVTVMACQEQYRFCNPNNGFCMPWMGILPILEYATNHNDKLQFNTAQMAAMARIFRVMTYSTVYHAINTRSQAALRATETLAGNIQLALPNNQWMIEVGAWFETGLARTQKLVQEYASGPTNILEGASITPPSNIYEQAMCYSQLTNSTSNTTSFSILGMAVLFIIGGLIILTSFFLEALIAWLQRRFKVGLHAMTAWHVDDKLQLQRQLFQETGRGHWSKSPDDFVPVTDTKEKFMGLFGTGRYGEYGAVSGGNTPEQERFERVEEGKGVAARVYEPYRA